MRWISPAAVVVTGLVASQALRFAQTNPPVEDDLSAPPAVEAAMRDACYGCHSNETKWPWYAQLAPISWLVHHDVREGRRHLNFSTWGAYASDPGTKLQKLDEMRRLIRSGEMPPWYYRLVHFHGAWPDTKRDAITDWVDREIAGSSAKP